MQYHDEGPKGGKGKRTIPAIPKTVIIHSKINYRAWKDKGSKTMILYQVQQPLAMAQVRGGEKNKRTTLRIPTWSPTIVLWLR
jgi:hypothetical protein